MWIIAYYSLGDGCSWQFDEKSMPKLLGNINVKCFPHFGCVHCVHILVLWRHFFWNCVRCGCSCSTVFYGQFQCTGDGADETSRVAWSHELTTQEAEPFMSHDFIDGDDWLWWHWKTNFLIVL